MAQIKTIKVGFGVSQATSPNNWIKASAEMEVELTDDDIKDKDAIWEGAWQRVTEEVAKQVKELLPDK